MIKFLSYGYYLIDDHNNVNDEIDEIERDNIPNWKNSLVLNSIIYLAKQV